jgi:hypothetical protein
MIEEKFYRLIKQQTSILKVHTQILQEQEFLIGLILKKLEKKARRIKNGEKRNSN